MSRRSSTLGPPGSHPVARSSSSPSSSANNTHSRRTTLDSLVTLQGESDALLANKERECEQLADQVELLKRQLASRPPKSEIESLRAEFRIQESLMAGFQRENEKATRELERVKADKRVLESELEKLVGPNWASSLNLTTFSSPHSSPALANASARAVFPSPSSLSGSSSKLRTGTSLSSSFVPVMEASFRTDSLGVADEGELDGEESFEEGSSGEMVEGAVLSPVKKAQDTSRVIPAGATPCTSLFAHSSAPQTPNTPFAGPSTPSVDSDPARIQREVQAVRLLVRGMEERLASREEELATLVAQAEREAARWREMSAS